METFKPLKTITERHRTDQTFYQPDGKRTVELKFRKQLKLGHGLREDYEVIYGLNKSCLSYKCLRYIAIQC